MDTKEIKTTANLIINSDDKKNYNKILPLIHSIITKDEVSKISDSTELESKQRFLVISLLQVFKKLFKRNHLYFKKNQSDDLKKFITWCKDIYNSYKLKLLDLLQYIDFNSSLSLDCLDSFLQLISLESKYFSETFFFPNKTLNSLLASMLIHNSNDNLISHFVDDFYSKYIDIQFYTQIELHSIISSSSNLPVSFIDNWISLINHSKHLSGDLEIYTHNPPSLIDNTGNFKSNFEKITFIVLNSDNLTIKQYKSILSILQKKIIPYLNNPIKLMDFLTDSYNLLDNNKQITDDLLIIPLLSLNALFFLIQKHNLDYPNFYSKLYQLLTPNLIHFNLRSRFFRLLSLFLNQNNYLSSNLIASFIKKLANLTIDAPISSIISILPFIYNLLKKHPSCMILIHNPKFIDSPLASREKQASLRILKKQYIDPFDLNETNPELTNAINSSLWEIDALTNHYNHHISSLAKIFSQPFKKQNYNIEDFLDWSFEKVLNNELVEKKEKKDKIVPALEYESVDCLLESKDAESEDKTVYLGGIAW